MAKKIILYGHAACPQVGPVKGVLGRAGIDYDYVNIRIDQEAAARVRDINDGFESVPTLVFPDGSTLTEPTFNQLKKKLTDQGYSLGFGAWLTGNFWILIVVLGVVIALLRSLGVF